MLKQNGENLLSDEGKSYTEKAQRYLDRQRKHGSQTKDVQAK
jgi:hypothetical protein